MSAANLRGANLRGCDLEGADLSDAWLQGADFTGARLVGARLAGAHMARCRLDGATLAADSVHLGDADQLATLLRGAAVWNGWRQEHREVEPDLPCDPCDAALAKLVRTQHALEQAAERTRFKGDAAQLELLRIGVERWNTYRSENPDVLPDLRGADLCDAALTGANLSRPTCAARCLRAQTCRWPTSAAPTSARPCCAGRTWAARSCSAPVSSAPT